MRRIALLLVLAAAPGLGGCTLTLGLTGGLIDNASMRRPGTRYTLDAPPPLDAPVEVVLRDGGEVAGAWRGIAESARTSSTPTSPPTVVSLVVLQDARGQRVEVPEAHVVQIRSRPRRSNAVIPMMLIGLVIDAVIAKSIYDESQCWFGGCGDHSY